MLRVIKIGPASAENTGMNTSTNNSTSLTLAQLQSLPKDRVRALFGLEPAALGLLMADALPVLIERRRAEQQAKPGRKRGPGGGRRRKLLPYQEVLITLLYLRHNVAHAVCGAMFGVSADISENSFHEVIPVLRDVCPAERFDAQKKWTKREPSWHPDTLDQVLVDSFETPVCRPSLPEKQRRLYSGKKKRHTVKSQIITDARGEVLSVETGHPGPSSDKTLYEGSRAAQEYPRAAQEYPRAAQEYPRAAQEYPRAAQEYPRAARRADLGYVGVPEMLLPHKRKRGKAGQKGPELTAAQKEENRYNAAQRVYVEHGVRRVKAWRIVRDEFRLATGLFPLVMAGTVGLVHLARLVTG
jgi:hypothetical protein